MKQKDVWFKHVWITKRIGIRWVPANSKGWVTIIAEFGVIFYAYWYATHNAKNDYEFAVMFLVPLLTVVLIGMYLGITRGEKMR